MKPIKLQKFTISDENPLTLISGPCVIENEQIAFETADKLKNLCEKLHVQLIYKSSYDKANRSSLESYRGPGIEKGLRLLEKVKKEFDLPIFTDVHTPEQAKIAGEVCDMLQIPAFLCRQTDLLVACAETGKPLSVKKGQFLAPWDMKNIIEKIEHSGGDQIILTERGFSFGYNNLISDMRAFPIMKKFGYPVCFDATHSVQLPGGESSYSGGQREFVFTLAKAAIAAGADLLYMESHPNPEKALCDQKCQIPLDQLPLILPTLIQLRELVRESVYAAEVD